MLYVFFVKNNLKSSTCFFFSLAVVCIEIIWSEFNFICTVRSSLFSLFMARDIPTNVQSISFFFKNSSASVTCFSSIPFWVNRGQYFFIRFSLIVLLSRWSKSLLPSICLSAVLQAFCCIRSLTLVNKSLLVSLPCFAFFAHLQVDLVLFFLPHLQVVHYYSYFVYYSLSSYHSVFMYALIL